MTAGSAKKAGCVPKGVKVFILSFIGIIAFGIFASIVGDNPETEEETQQDKGENNPSKPITEFEKQRLAAESGDGAAQYELGFRYSAGDGVPANEEEAMKWWRKSAENGYAQAQFTLGLCYMQGDGVTTDKAEAIRWWIKSAEGGFSQAQVRLGFSYRDGNGVAPDMAEAVKWWKLAAEQGNSDGQYYLGMAYKDGNGIPRNDAEAYMWLYLVHIGWPKGTPGDWSLPELQSLSHRMTPSQIEQAKQRAHEWQAASNK